MAEARATNYTPFWWGGLMASNWPLLLRNPAWHVTSDTRQSRLHPQVRIGDAVAPLNGTPKILGVTLDTHDCVERASRALNAMKALAGTSRPKLWWPRIRRSCASSSTMPPSSGSPKCPYHTRTNLRWFRMRLWGSWPVAIKRLRPRTSEPRLGSSPWGRT